MRVGQIDFKINDLDGDGSASYWRYDVAGLYVTPHQGKVLKCVPLEVAEADCKWLVPPTPECVRKPKNGYLFRAIRVTGEKWPSPDCFAFCAFPVEYSGLSCLTFIMREDGEVYYKDLGAGSSGVDVFPGSPEAEGWEKGRW